MVVSLRFGVIGRIVKIPFRSKLKFEINFVRPSSYLTKPRGKAQTHLAFLGTALTGWTLTSATDISNDGSTIVGLGTNPDGDTAGWVVDLVATIDTSDQQRVKLAEIEFVEAYGDSTANSLDASAFQVGSTEA